MDTPGGPRHFWIDVGGTFTDCIAAGVDGKLRSHKLLSTGVYKGAVGPGSTCESIEDVHRAGDPTGFFSGWEIAFACDPPLRARIAESGGGRLTLATPMERVPSIGGRYELRCDLAAPLIGIRWLLGLGPHQPIGPVAVRLGTTRGTNALLERRGAATALVTTAGFGDMLRIGYQARPRLFDLHIRKPAELYRTSVEVAERVAADGTVLKPLDEYAARGVLEKLRRDGIVSLAVCLLNSYRNPAHELAVERIARDVGFEHVSLATRLLPLQRIVPRAETALIDAYLSPVIGEYVRSIRIGMPEGRLELMTSAGSLSPAQEFVARDSVLSGPAGGVVGVARVSEMLGGAACIGFDMGGTSTDVCRYAGEYERRYEMAVVDRDTGGHIRIAAPMLAIETVAAGGGSICGFDGIKPTVGPNSAGADPGPACYGRGGPLCVTDIDVFLGRVPTDALPFPLDRAAIERRLDEWIERIAAATGRRYEQDELATGYARIVTEHMAGAIRRISIERGHDPRGHTLVSFGGAGGQHACALARELGIRTIVHHPLAGLLSAYGIGHATTAVYAARDISRRLDADGLCDATAVLDDLTRGLKRELAAREGAVATGFVCVQRLDLRYRGQDTPLTITQPPDGNWRASFERAHAQQYGFAFSGRDIEILCARVEVRAKRTCGVAVADAAAKAESVESHSHPMSASGTRGRDVPVYRRDELREGMNFTGPAIVCEATSTLWIESGWSGAVEAEGLIRLTIVDEHVANEAVAADDPIQLELFYSRFASVAEEMGATLQRTALSTNVKERLDFSCAVFDPDGNLVSHAPHIPVHLGAMSHCVKCLIADLVSTGGMRPDEVYVTNDPYRGGSHLPDVTVVTPVFDPTGGRLYFYVASRAHHAEIGGLTPGSMPPQSRTLAEEGVLIRALRLRCESAGVGHAARIDDRELRTLLASDPFPSRNVEQNVADILAQVAANRRGVLALHALAERCGTDVVQRQMRRIQDAAEAKCRMALGRMPAGTYTFNDALDDGTPIAVQIEIRDGAATIDLSGSGGVHPGNLNAVPAIVASAVLYCLRCLIGEETPLNAGLLQPIAIRIPPGSVLNPPSDSDPAKCPAVVGGNVETSQRIVDCIFGALGVVAASQGTMNNLTFGPPESESGAVRGLSYYETICGGAGAGPGFAGADAVHTHMTNTRLTDPEVLEDRYPVRLHRFAIRRGSGGAGRHRGGDGVVREIEILAPLEISLLTQRRRLPPYGLAGGQPGATGRNTLVHADGSEQQLDFIAHVIAQPGDLLRIETPGGGGFGVAD